MAGLSNGHGLWSDFAGLRAATNATGLWGGREGISGGGGTSPSTGQFITTDSGTDITTDGGTQITTDT